jgi:uncharacterized lipoprotein NlpE involved in copper resistance
MKIIFSSLAALLLLYGCSPDKKTESTTEKSAITQVQFNPDAGKQVSDKEAMTWAKSFASKYPEDLRGYYFSAESYKKVLETPGATGIRIYIGLNAEGSKVMILTPTDKAGNTIPNGTMYEFGQACPPYCNDGN